MTTISRRKAGIPHSGASPADAVETGKYICDMVLELRNMSNRAGLAFLTQLLEMTYHEAFMISNRVVPNATELEELQRIMAHAKSSDAKK